MPAPTDIVIVGAGIIGVSTAYFLTQHPSYDRRQTSITIIENCEVAAGASGKAGGLLALDWHSQATSSLAQLSYNLHAQLARDHNGSDKWGYRQLNTLSVQSNSKRKKSQRRKSDVQGAAVGGDIDWLDPQVVEKTSVLGTKATTAQVHPRKFCRELLAIAESAGVKFVLGKVTGVGPGSVTYTSNASRHAKTVKSDCSIIAAGPWTRTILPEAPIMGTRAHSITIVPTRQVSAHAVFTSMTLADGSHVTPELYARSDEIYVCGDGDSEPVPESAHDVQVVEAKCDELFNQVSELSSVLADGRVGVKQACYLPVAETSLGAPLVGRVPGREGVYIASAHTCWGICLGPGTGKVMSELVFDGKAASADIRLLDPASSIRQTQLKKT